MATREEFIDAMNEVNHNLGFYTDGVKSIHFTDNETTDIHVWSEWEEPGWEYFSPETKVSFNGQKVYGNGSANVGPYHNVSTKEGIFDKPEQLADVIESFTGFDNLEQVYDQPELNVDSKARRLDDFNNFSPVKEAKAQADAERAAQKQALEAQEQARENARKHWERVNSHGGFLKVDVNPQQIHPVRSEKALSWDKGIHGREYESNEMSSRSVEFGNENAVNTSPVWVDIAKDKRVFVPSGLMDRHIDGSFSFVMEPNNTKKVFTGPSLKGEDVLTSEIAGMAGNYKEQLDSRRASTDFVTIPADMLYMTKTRDGQHNIGIVTLPKDVNNLDGSTMSFVVDERRMRPDPVQDQSVVLYMGYPKQFNVQFSDNTPKTSMSADDLKSMIRNSLDAYADRSKESESTVDVSYDGKEAREKVTADLLDEDSLSLQDSEQFE